MTTSETRLGCAASRSTKTSFEALSQAGINIDAISTSEIVISCIVRHQDGPRALQVVHGAFDLDELGSSTSRD
ncbi:MAG: ACT domain-containing protein [Planctomycetota bacterium]